MTEQNVERKRGRRIIKSETTKNKTITLYTIHFNSLYKNQIELSSFVRWLITNKQDVYLNLDMPTNKYEGNTEQTTISLYPDEYKHIDVKIIDSRNFSNFLKWGIDNFVEEYIKSESNK